ncbi:MAG: M56 family metallopeptidase [Verrucomicrobiota bacterium]
MESINTWSRSSALPWLADVSLQTALILSVALVVVWLGRQRLSASKQHTILAVALFSIPALMIAAICAPSWGTRTSDSSNAVPAAAETIRVGSGAASAIADTSSAPASAQPILTKTPAPSILPLLGFLIWILGLGVCGSMTLTSAYRLRQLRLAASPIRSGFRVETLESLRAELGISEQRALTLLESSTNSMPMTWGWKHAVILLPAESASWDETRLKLVLRHELAHVARGDSAISLGGFLCASLLWFHPLSWLCCRQLWRVRESACDDHVLQACNEDPAGYAEQLLAAIRAVGDQKPRLSVPALAMAMGMSQLGKQALMARIRAVLDDRRERSHFSTKILRIAAPIWLLGAIGLGGLSACREITLDVENAKANPASATNEASQRIFILTDNQWQRLTNGKDWFRENVNDPFAAPSATMTEVATPSTEQLAAAALEIRSRLIEEGVEFDFKTTEEASTAVTLADKRTLVITADESVLTKVADLLKSFAIGQQISIRAHVFRVPNDFEFMVELRQSSGGSKQPAITGVVDATTAKALLERVEKTDGASIISRPTVVTGSGTTATIEEVREFIYPTEYDPPEIPADFQSLPGAEPKAFPVTPASPAAFETRNTGLIMEYTPIVNKDGQLVIGLKLERNNFEGFINYGSPIHAAVENTETGDSDSVVLTENRIVMPVFASSTYASEIIVGPDDWIVVGGLGETKDLDVRDFETDPAIGIEVAVDSKLESQSMLFFLIRAELIE